MLYYNKLFNIMQCVKVFCPTFYSTGNVYPLENDDYNLFKSLGNRINKIQRMWIIFNQITGMLKSNDSLCCKGEQNDEKYIIYMFWDSMIWPCFIMKLDQMSTFIVKLCLQMSNTAVCQAGFFSLLQKV